VTLDGTEDIYSNAWLGTLRALELRHERLTDEEVRKYLLTAVAHHASKELRRRSRKPTAPLDEVAVPDDGAPPEERAAKLEESRLTRDLLASLPPRRRAVMLLRYGWGLEPTQVCGLVKGLSLRAYRKEITRGVDELTEKLSLVERGEWCSDREPVLKAYASGLADAEQQRQAQQHLSHCRHCTDFVGKLTGHPTTWGHRSPFRAQSMRSRTDGCGCRITSSMRSGGSASRPLALSAVGLAVTPRRARPKRWPRPVVPGARARPVRACWRSWLVSEPPASSPSCVSAAARPQPPASRPESCRGNCLDQGASTRSAPPLRPAVPPPRR